LHPTFPHAGEQTVSEIVNDSLAAALARHHFALPEEQAQQLDRYARLLWEWNEKLNLTRHTDYEKFVARDVLDTLELSKLLRAGEEVLDVGTGGGVPGVVLSIVRPDLQVTLCESVGKKAAAVEQIIRQLKLETPLYPNRAEEVLEDSRFDACVARAVGPLAKFCVWFKDHWASIGRLLAIKGPHWTDERQAARQRGLLNNLELRVAASYPMPGTHSESVIIKMWPKGAPEK
jgi:16S rRNA (guanine527-N7)-methyltransferase